MDLAAKWKMIIAGLAAAVLLGGCAGSGSGTQTSTPEQTPMTSSQTAAAQTASAQTATPTTASASSGEPSDTDSQAQIAAGFAAVALAESEVPGSQAIELERDGRNWEVKVIEGDQQTEFYISLDGTQVLKREQGRADSRDVTRLAQVQVGIVDAIRTAMGSQPGVFLEADLDTERGQVVWEIGIRTPREVTVYVDVVSGKIINP